MSSNKTEIYVIHTIMQVNNKPSLYFPMNINGIITKIILILLKTKYSFTTVIIISVNINEKKNKE